MDDNVDSSADLTAAWLPKVAVKERPGLQPSAEEEWLFLATPEPKRSNGQWRPLALTRNGGQQPSSPKRTPSPKREAPEAPPPPARVERNARATAPPDPALLRWSRYADEVEKRLQGIERRMQRNTERLIKTAGVNGSD